MASKVRLANRISDGVDHRLRMWALVKRLRLTDALTVLLDEALPSADELAGQLGEKRSVS
jgi:hypothetical protein